MVRFSRNTWPWMRSNLSARAKAMIRCTSSQQSLCPLSRERNNTALAGVGDTQPAPPKTRAE
jgi:hypothetical protein